MVIISKLRHKARKPLCSRKPSVSVTPKPNKRLSFSFTNNTPHYYSFVIKMTI